MKKVLVIFAALILASTLITFASACETATPSITLSPNQGFATTTIAGSGFCQNAYITIKYDNAVQPTVPSTVQTDCNGKFTAIISVPDELAVGPHTINATDSRGDSATATYTVVDMKGPQGSEGATGPQGTQGIQGPQGLQGTTGPQGIAGQSGADFNATGNVLLFNGTDGTNGNDGLDFNATGNVLLFNGTNGVNGANGLNGSNGTNGINGVNGVNGKDGKDGSNGSNGVPGVNGKVVYVDPPIINGSFVEYLLIVSGALLAFIAAMITCYRWKQKTPVK